MTESNQEKSAAPTAPNAWSRRQFLITSGLLTATAMAPWKARAQSRTGEGSGEWTDNQRRRIVVIGSGIGGMSVGALFSKAGHQVTVLEMHPTLIGGQARHPEFQGLKFSMGPQYVWNFKAGDIGDRFLRHLAIQDLTPFVSMDPEGFETNFVYPQGPGKGTLCCEVPMGLARFRDQLCARFPEQGRKLTRMFDDLIDIYETYKAFITKHDLSNAWKAVLDLLLAWDIPFGSKLKLTRAGFSSLKEWLDQYQIDELPRRILYGHGGIFLENESVVSALSYIVGTGNYHDGAHYPANGFYTFFDTLRGVIEQHGGRVELGKRVVGIHVQDDLASEVVCADGAVYPADVVVSNISPRLTCDLVPLKYRVRYDYEPSRGTLACCIGVQGRLSVIQQMRGRNYWYQDGDGEVDYERTDMDRPPRMLYLSSHTSNGFGNTPDNPGDDSLVAFAVGDHRQEQSIHAQGQAAVAQYKQRLAAEIVEIIDRTMLPGLKSRVRFVEIVDTVDMTAEIDAEAGSVYGRRMSIQEIRKGAPALLPLANLFNVSSTQHGAGIAPGISGGAALLKRLTGITV